MDVRIKKMCLNISMLYAERGNHLTDEQQMGLYKQCLDIALDLGSYHHSLVQYDEVIKYHEMCLEITNKIGDRAGEVAQYEKKICVVKMSLDIAKRIGDKAEEGSAHGSLGNGYYILRQYDKAIEHYKLKLNIVKNLGDKASEGKIYGHLGRCYHFLGQCDKAIEHHEMSLNIAKQMGDKKGEGQVYCHLGRCYHSLGQYAKAIEHHEMSLNIAKQIGDKEGEGDVYNNLGINYNCLAQYEKAIQHHEMSLNIAKQIEDKEGEGCAYCNLGTCYRSLAQYNKAIQHHEMSLNISIQIGDKKGEGHSYGNLGGCYQSLGQYDKAIKHYEMCLNIVKQIGNKADEAKAYCNLGSSCHCLAQYDKAIQHHEMSLNIAIKIGDKNGVEFAHGSLGNNYVSLGQYESAIRHYEMSLEIAKQIGDKAGEGGAYASLGVCYHSLQQYDKAIQLHKISLSIAKQVGDKACEERTYGNLGNCYYSLRQYDKAIEHFEMCKGIAKQTGDKADEGSAYRNLGTYYQLFGQYDKAESNFVKSISCFEDLFRNAPKEDQSKIGICDRFISAYSQLASVFLEEDKPEEALAIAERGRARALAELMLTNHSALCTEVTEASVLTLSDIRDVVKAINTSVLFMFFDTNGICMWMIQPNGVVEFKRSNIVKSTTSKKHSLLTSHAAGFVEETLKLLISRARMKDGEDCNANCEDRSLSFLYPEEQTKSKVVFDRMAATEEEISGSPVCVSGHLTPQRDGIQNATLPGSTQEPEPRCIEELEEEEEKSTESNPLHELYRLVLEPVRHLVKGSHLVIVADGALNLVPFPALIDENEQYVAETLQVRLIPSLATAKMIIERPQEPGSQASPLIIGDPGTNLPGAYKEAVMIGRLFGVQPLTRKDATKENFLRNVENANLIHIAAHGDMKRGEILLASNSGIDSSKKEDYMLMMSDLEKKCLKAKLVVLSCCHSARGEVKAEGVIGIARAFIGAGARAVLVALWAIDDGATLYFMEKFYEHLVHGGKASESLNKAMKDMRDHTKFRFHCYRSWAPFVLIGDNVSLV